MCHAARNPREHARRNEQLGLFGAPAKPKQAKRKTPKPRTDVWVMGDGGIAPHDYTPNIPELDTKKLPTKFQGNYLRKMDNGDWIMWPIEVERGGKTYKTKPPKLEGSGKKKVWKWENPAPGVPANKRSKTALGGKGGLSNDQLQAIQFAHTLKGSSEKRALSLIKQNGLYAINHSAGKDSQAMFLYLHRDLQIPADQTVVIHADLPGADWPSLLLPSGIRTPTLQEHMEDSLDGMPYRVVVAHWGTGERTPEHLRGTVKSFESVVRHQFRRRPDVPSFPSKSNRWCTSDLKASPLNRAIREEICVRNNLREPFQKDSARCKVGGTTRGGKPVPSQPWRVIISCEGLRGGESADRSKLHPFELDIDKCKEGRIWFTWLPIHDWTSKTDGKDYDPSKTDVTEYILGHGQAPFWTYGSTPEHMAMIQERAPGAEHGVSRLSCQFCIFSSKKDQAITSQLDPDAYARMCALEKDVGSSVSMGGETLIQRTGLVPAASLTRKVVANPWTALRVRHPAGHNPDEEFSVHDLQLAEILVKGPSATANVGRSDIKRRLMGGTGRRGARQTASNPGQPLGTPWPGVVLVPRTTGDPGLLESYEVVADGVSVGAVDYVRVGRDKRWAARTNRARHDTDHIQLEFQDGGRDAAIKVVLKRAGLKPAYRRDLQRAERAQPLSSTMGERNPRLAELKKKLMR